MSKTAKPFLSNLEYLTAMLEYLTALAGFRRAEQGGEKHGQFSDAWKSLTVGLMIVDW